MHPARQYGAGGVDGALRLQPVYSSVRILAEGVAQLPWEQFRDTGDQQVKMPLGQLLAKPSAFGNKFDWKYQYVSSAALDGTAFGLITQTDGPFGRSSLAEKLRPTSGRMPSVGKNVALTRRPLSCSGSPLPVSVKLSNAEMPTDENVRA